jgi:hypothetical protein
MVERWAAKVEEGDRRVRMSWPILGPIELRTLRSPSSTFAAHRSTIHPA